MKHRILAILMILGLFAAGCGKRKDSGERGEILVLCGSSFRSPTEELAEAFEKETGVDVTFSFGESENLLPHVKLKKMGDVLVTHDPYLDYTKEADALLEGVQVGFVAPVLVVRKGNPAGVKSIEDLAKPGVKVALPNPEFSTCGEMLFALLEKKGIREAVENNAENAIFRSHSQTGNALKLGTRDVGVMWNGTAHNFLDAIEIVSTPYEYDKEIRVWVMGLSYSKNKKLVGQFLEFCRENGKAIFEKYGYVK